MSNEIPLTPGSCAWVKPKGGKFCPFCTFEFGSDYKAEQEENVQYGIDSGPDLVILCFPTRADRSHCPKCRRLVNVEGLTFRVRRLHAGYVMTEEADIFADWLTPATPEEVVEFFVECEEKGDQLTEGRTQNELTS